MEKCLPLYQKTPRLVLILNRELYRYNKHTVHSFMIKKAWIGPYQQFLPAIKPKTDLCGYGAVRGLKNGMVQAFE